MAYVDSFQFVLNELLKDLREINDTLAVIGLMHLGKFALKTLYQTYVGTRTYILPRIFTNKRWLQSLGKWAVVSGSSSGIGLAYAKELAKLGFDLVLIGLDGDALDRAADYFVNNYQVQVVSVACDLTKSESFERVEKVLIGRDIGVLVNCAGVNHGPELFHQSPYKSISDQIMVNTLAISNLIRTVLPTMVSKNKGAIVNISSMSTQLPLPYYSVYGATKAFVEKLTDSLRYEYSNTKIVFQCLSPSVVKTKMTMDMDYEQVKKCPTNAIAYAKNAITTLGYSDFTCGHWYHGYQYFFMTMIPKPVFDLFYAKLFKIMYENYKQRRLQNPQLMRKDFSDVDEILND